MTPPIPLRLQLPPAQPPPNPRQGGGGRCRGAAPARPFPSALFCGIGPGPYGRGLPPPPTALPLLDPSTPPPAARSPTPAEVSIPFPVAVGRGTGPGLVASGKGGMVTGEWGGLGGQGREMPLSQEAALLGNLWPVPPCMASLFCPPRVPVHFADRTALTSKLKSASPGGPGPPPWFPVLVLPPHLKRQGPGVQAAAHPARRKGPKLPVARQMAALPPSLPGSWLLTKTARHRPAWCSRQAETCRPLSQAREG